jgi:hypothetical protein
MAKMFYTIEEAAEKLGKTVDQVSEMAGSGQIQEFRDKDKIMFKVDQIDLLAIGGDDDLGDIPLSLEESGEMDPLSLSGSAPVPVDEDALSLSGSMPAALDSDDEDDPFSLSDSGTGNNDPLEMSASGAIGLEDSGTDTEDSFLGGSAMGTGVSAFETETDGDDTGGGSLLDDDLSLETVGSGSGLLDLTRESDDTSLGAELLDEVYSNDEGSGELPANASGLFEAADEESGGAVAEMGTPMPAMGGIPMVVESYEGGWSGLSVGMSLVAIAALCLVGLMAFVTATNTLPAVAEMITGQMTMWFGGLLAGVFILGLLGFFIGKASE